LASIDAWNIKALEKRFTIIKKRFLQIWKYPDIQLDTAAVEGEVTIFEAEAPTGKSLEYIIFRDEKKEIKTVTDLYQEVIKQLFESQPETFFSTDLAESLPLTHKENIDTLLRPVQINDTWFIETKINKKSKFRKIKHLLTIFDMEEELIIKYAEGSMQKASPVDEALEYDKKVKGYAGVRSLGNAGYIGYWGGIGALKDDLADPSKRAYVIYERQYKWREKEKTGSNTKNWIPIQEFVLVFDGV
jgi:hypothetical protein